jgi:hypothetical protein
VVESTESDEAEVDPQEKLTEVLAQQAELAEVEAKMLAQKEVIEAEARDLHHKLARTQVKVLFKLLDDFAGFFTDGAVVGKYEEIGDCLASISHHDPDISKSLASNKYADVVGDHPYFEWWLNLLQSYLIPGLPLNKVMVQMWSKPSGSPFQQEK